MTNLEHGAWHRKVIPASTEAVLFALRDAHLLDHFYLAGGTGLALQFGHRRLLGPGLLSFRPSTSMKTRFSSVSKSSKASR